MPMKFLRRLSAMCLMLTMFLPLCAQAALTTPGKGLCSKTDCFWEMPMDMSDPDWVWSMLTTPMTVVKGNYRDQQYLYAEKSESSQRIAEVTCATQGVHVLSQSEDGWSLVECYSSSFEGSKVKAWNQLVQGYIRTELLQEVEVNQTWGLVVDKLSQRLHVFKDGMLLDTLAVSTGYAEPSTPYNESRSGEYLLYSRTGEFPSGDLFCDYGIRYNDGDLIHEVPHKKYFDEEGNLERVGFYHCEPYLGEKASHGCIRVQRLKSSQGINMEWLWDNMYNEVGNIRMVIWEDWPGRTLETPDDSFVLYYNPKGGDYYHKAETCYGVKTKYLPLTPFTYGELGTSPFDDLEACPYCCPERRPEDIFDINTAHLE